MPLSLQAAVAYTCTVFTMFSAASTKPVCLLLLWESLRYMLCGRLLPVLSDLYCFLCCYTYAVLNLVSLVLLVQTQPPAQTVSQGQQLQQTLQKVAALQRQRSLPSPLWIVAAPLAQVGRIRHA